jgi:glycosyltransferase involved in cell wall biosynthesis
MHSISAIIITYNEEKHIAACLSSLKNVADEIIVLDSFSTDNTAAICHSYPVIFKQNKFINFASQRNIAMSYATKSYLLFIDADEVLSESLIASLIQLKQKGFDKKVYTLNRMTNFCGKWIKHGMWYPDKIQRIIASGEGKWVGEVHEKLQFHNAVSKGLVNGHLLHYSYDSIKALVEKLEKYTTMQSKEMQLAGKKAPIYKMMINPLWAFLNGYFFKLGFLDGWQGFIIQYSIAYQTYRKYVKLRILNEL